MISAILTRLIDFGHSVVGSLEYLNAAVKSISEIDFKSLQENLSALEVKMETLKVSEAGGVSS